MQLRIAAGEKRAIFSCCGVADIRNWRGEGFEHAELHFPEPVVFDRDGQCTR